MVFVCDVPGIKPEEPEELEVTLENHVLTIKGSRTFESMGDQQVLLGRSDGSFDRAFLSSGVRR